MSTTTNGAPSAETVESVAGEVVDAAKSIGPVTSQLGQGFLALSVTAAAATFALRRFKQAWDAKP